MSASWSDKQPSAAPGRPADGFNLLAPPNARLAIAFASGLLPLLEMLVRREEPRASSEATLLAELIFVEERLLPAALAHGSEREAAALAASLTRLACAQLRLGDSTLVGAVAGAVESYADVAGQSDNPTERQLCGLLCSMVVSLSDTYAAGVPFPRGLPTTCESGALYFTESTKCLLLSVCAASFVAVVRAGHGTAAGAAPLGSRSWRQVLLQLQPLELLQLCLSAASSAVGAELVCRVAGAVTLVLREETRAAVTRTGNSPTLWLQPAALRRIGSFLRDEGEHPSEAAAAAATASLWEAWASAEVGRPLSSAREAALAAKLKAVLSWGELRLPLPTPAEALALLQLHSCGNPLCAALGGDSEAGVQLKACGRCGAAAYCSR
jgi:hypothetical protein